MDQATQQNAALVEEATAAARAMEEQAQQLSQAVASFKLDSGADIRLSTPVTAITAAPPAPAANTVATGTSSAAPAKRKQAPARTVRAATRKQAAAAQTAVAGDSDWQEF